MRSVALDLGAKKIAYCEVSGGKVIERATVGSLSLLEPMLGPKAATARVAIEACREAWFVHATLTEWGNEVLLVDTTRSQKMGIGQHRRKNDRIDAEVMAHAVEQGGIPLAHVLSPHRQELRRQLSVRRALVETRAQYVTTIRGSAREYGCTLRSCDTEQFVANVRKALLRSEVRATIAPLLATLGTLELELAGVEQRLQELSAMEPVVAQLTTTPGVGSIIAASFVSVIDEARRFRKRPPGRVVPRAGAEWGQHGRQAPPRLHQQAGQQLSARALGSRGMDHLAPARADRPLAALGVGHCRATGKRIAVVALARRLAGVLWAMWRDGTVYDPELVARSGARGLRRAAQSIELRAAALERAAIKVRRHRTRPATTTEVNSIR